MAANDINNYKSNVQVKGTAKVDNIYNSAHHVTVNAGKGNDIVEFASGSLRSIYKYANGDGNDTIIGYDNFTEGVIQLTSGNISTYSIDSETGDHVLKIGKGSITLKNVKTDTIAIKTKSKNYRYVKGKAFNDPKYNGNNYYITYPIEGTKYDDFINVGGENVTINADAGDDFIVNDAYVANKYFLINAGVGNDTISNFGNYATINAGAGDDVIYANGFGEIIKYIKGDGNDLIYGFNSYDTIKIINSDYTTTESGQDVILNVDGGKITLKDAKGETLNIKAAAATLNDLDIVTLTNKDKKVYTADYNVGTIDVSKRKKAIKIIGNSDNNSIVGGTKADTLVGGDGNDTLTGGTGKDMFVHSSGDDVITDYTSGQDKIKLDGTEIVNYDFDDLDVKFTTEKGTLTVENVKGKKLTITNSNKKALDCFFGSGSISGTKSKEVIYGSDGDDTIRGGKGNDTLYGGDGADVFMYTSGDGSDVIADFTSEDVVKLGSKKTKVNVKKSKVSGNDYILTIGKNNIKLIGAANRSINVVDYDGNVQVYNSQKSYAELFADNNLATSEIDAILESNFEINDYNGKNDYDEIFNYNVDDSVIRPSDSLCNSYGQVNNDNNH